MSPAVAVIVENTLQALYTGLVLGCVYGLMCVGLALIFSVMRVINFAQGEFLMLGMYAALFVFTQLGISALLGPYVGPIVAAVLGGAIVFGVGIVAYEGLLRWITGLEVAGTEGEGHYPQLTLTLGLSLLLSNGGLIVFGSEPQTMRTPMSSNAWELGPLFGSDITLFLNQARSLSSVVALAVAAAVALFIARTRLGKMLRAAADNPEAATYMGIHVGRAYRLAFGIGAAVTAIAGGLVATYYPFQPYIGIEFVIVMYAGVVLGGMGSVSGAFWGGLTIGLIQQLSTLVLPNQLQNATIFVAFLLIVLLRPQGLFGRSVERV
ncbi:MAG TPA: branched-chain amino acid ABC transporter permease [Casimicrobiaceae bacterium]|jgi:branched-chain amino acid transport system permease protein